MGIEEAILEYYKQLGIYEGMQIGIEKAAYQCKVEMAIRGLRKNLPVDLLAEVIGLTPDEVVNIARSKDLDQLPTTSRTVQ